MTVDLGVPNPFRTGEIHGVKCTRRGFFARLVAGGAALAAGSVVYPDPVIGKVSKGPSDAMETWERAAARFGIPGQESIDLFNGRDLEAWDAYLVEEGVGKDDVWSVEDGILVCKGEPGGYLYTRDDFQDFRLVVEWRWPEEPGNSGVLLRVDPEPVMLPSSVEAQLRSGSAGDMYGFQGFAISGDPERLSKISIGWSLRKTVENENEPGEWNRYEITADKGDITVVLNGMTVNEARDCEVRPGRIGLQSEGGVVHFRTVALTTLG